MIYVQVLPLFMMYCLHVGKIYDLYGLLLVCDIYVGAWIF